MNNEPTSHTIPHLPTDMKSPLLPLWLKLAYTAFMAVLVPVYWVEYGPTNFLYFCDIALFLTLYGLWKESALAISMAAVGILLPQALWCADFLVEACGGTLTTMAAYMFDPTRSLFLRGLSLFHGWLPFLLVWVLRRTGYDARGLVGWSGLGLGACLISYFFLPPPGVAAEGTAHTPRNVNFVYGMSDTAAQTWVSQSVYLCLWMVALVLLVYLPTHFLLRRFFTKTNL